MVTDFAVDESRKRKNEGYGKKDVLPTPDTDHQCAMFPRPTCLHDQGALSYVEGGCLTFGESPLLHLRTILSWSPIELLPPHRTACSVSCNNAACSPRYMVLLHARTQKKSDRNVYPDPLWPPPEDVDSYRARRLSRSMTLGFLET